MRKFHNFYFNPYWFKRDLHVQKNNCLFVICLISAKQKQHISQPLFSPFLPVCIENWMFKTNVGHFFYSIIFHTFHLPLSFSSIKCTCSKFPSCFEFFLEPIQINFRSSHVDTTHVYANRKDERMMHLIKMYILLQKGKQCCVSISTNIQ